MKLYRNNVEFTTQFGVDRDTLNQRDGQKMIDRQKAQRAIDMGLMLSAKKEWVMQPEGNIILFRQHLWVLTDSEIKELVERARGGFMPLWDREDAV
jgi:hypothetical protein